MYSSIIFQTFDSDISKTISKIGVFGKSFNEIFTLIKQRSAEIKDLKKSGVNPDEHLTVHWGGSARCEGVLPRVIPAQQLLLPCKPISRG